MKVVLSLRIHHFEKEGEKMRLPYFTLEGWLMLLGAGVLGGIIGATMLVMMISQFLKP
jgi:hypothetical protein